MKWFWEKTHSWKELERLQVMQMNAESFARTVEQETALVDFYADWCVYCRRLAPVLEQVAAECEGRLVVGKVDVEAENALARAEDIELLPTLKLYRSGSCLGALIAPDSKDRILAFLREKLGDAE